MRGPATKKRGSFINERFSCNFSSIRILIAQTTRAEVAVHCELESTEAVLRWLPLEGVVGAKLINGPAAGTRVGKAVRKIKVAALGMIYEERNVQIQTPAPDIHEVNIASVMGSVRGRPDLVAGCVLAQCWSDGKERQGCSDHKDFERSDCRSPHGASGLRSTDRSGRNR